MGRDKAFLPIAGRPLIEHVIRALRSVFGKIIVVTNTPGPYAAYDVQVVSDAFDKRGSLIGLYSGLLRSEDDYNFVVACDMPYLNRSLISYMAGLAPGHDIVVPAMDGLLEPLHAVYSRSLLPRIEKQILQDHARIRELYRHARVREVGAEEIDRFDPGRMSFRNLNTPQEYEEAACADWECPS